eukprot:5779605-Amphidinium_carterae.1
MNQLAAEKIRSTQLQTYSAQLKYEKDMVTNQLLDLTRHAAISGVCQDIHWTSNREPEGFSEYVDQVLNNEDSGIHLVPPFANQPLNTPPRLFVAADVDERAPQTPDRRPQQTSSSPPFGLLAAMDGSRGSGSNGKGAGSTPNRVRDGNRTRRPGRGGDGGDGDDDDDDFLNDGNGGNRGNQPLGEWNDENDAWARNRSRPLAMVAASP